MKPLFNSKPHQERMARFRQTGLYLVTSQDLSPRHSTLQIIRAALNAGVRLIQLREKNMPPAKLFPLAQKARELTAVAGALLIINDRLDLAMAVEADGVHLGQDDLPLAAARKLAPHMILGASTHNLAEARQAIGDGASYINIGPIFPTRSKPEVENFLGVTGLVKIARHVTVPWTVMGGIKKENIPMLRQAGARTFALITAVTAATNPGRAARELLQIIRRPC